MAREPSHTPDVDLDKTDQLPILEGAAFDEDIQDDAVPIDRTAVLPGFVPPVAQPDFVRPSAIDLPSLAESVREVEERIARQNAEFEALTRAYERARDAEGAQGQRADALAADLAEARAALAARDATIVQVLHSLGERDAQLSALQAEHAKMVPALEATSRSLAQMEADLRTARADANALAAELKASRDREAAFDARLGRGESEANAARSELAAVKRLANSYLERLRSREWRRGFDQNLFRDLDAQVGAAHLGSSALESERDGLQRQLADLEARRVGELADLEARRVGELADLEARRVAELAAAEAERARLAGELSTRDLAIFLAQEQSSGDARRVAELLEAAKRQEAEHATQIAQLQAAEAAQIAQLESEMETREQEMAVLMAHLQEARRPVQSFEADIKLLTEELAAKSAALHAAEEENGKLQASLERTRGALEEREFLIRRLERSESNNANVLGRIQTTIERLGSAPAGLGAGAAAGLAADWSAELIRLDGGQPVTYKLSRRMRIGRATDCELHIDSSSVSRHHALVMMGPRGGIIEDLNSTNGVVVNGRKVTRHLLCDGDAVTLGDIQFRYLAKPLPRSPEPDPAEPALGK
jgi:chromosome segregation ATPase